MKKLSILVLFVLFFAISTKDVRAVECSASTTCGNTCSYGGVTYNTVVIGTQCWFKENLNALRFFKKEQEIPSLHI